MAPLCCLTLVQEVDGFHARVLLVADLQLVEFAKEVDQPLHHLHPLFTEPAAQRSHISTHSTRTAQGGHEAC